MDDVAGQGSLLDYIKIARPGFWLTQLWFYLLPFSGRHVLIDPAFWFGCFYVTFPLSLLVYGWNDLGDVETDRLNPRKGNWLFGARPDAATRKKLPWVIALVQIPCLAGLVVLGGPKMLVWFAAVVFVNAAYNSGMKSRPILDLFPQLGYLLIFVLGSWLCDVPQLNVVAMVFCGLFAIQSHLLSELMDIDEDRTAKRSTTVVVLGVKRSKWLLVGIMLTETAIAWTFFSSQLVGLFMALATTLFLLDAIAGPRRYPLKLIRTFFIGWNLIVLGSMYFVWKWGLFTLVAYRY